MKTIFNHCPQCTSSNIETNNGHKHVCKDCKFEYYHNVASSVAVILYNQENEILFTVRNENPGIGLLDLPGGFVDYRENANDTVIRELKEELNINLKNNSIYFFGSFPNEYLYKNILYHTLDLCFTVKIEKSCISDFDKGEIQAIKWLKREDINLDLFAFSSTKTMITEYLKIIS